MRILSIETSCDETSLALLDAHSTGSGQAKVPRFKVLKNLVASQINIHRPFGGVVPNLAKREHLKNLPILYRQIFNGKNEKENLKNIDVVAVTVGPGLEPALWTGINFAKELYLKAKSYNLKPVLIGANHMEGHLYSFLLENKKIKLPAVALLVSGGHTMLLLMKSLTRWKKLGETRDDAIGEAFDKVARLLGLPYPGGPEVEKLALRHAQGKPENERGGTIPFPRPMMRTKDYDFSFSGLKTAVLYYLRDIGHSPLATGKKYASGQKPVANFADVAASFQEAAFEVVVYKTIRAAKEYKAKSIILGGGVAASKTLRDKLQATCDKEKLKLFVPGFEFVTDNAAMVAAAAYINFLRKKKYPLTANGNLSM